MDAQNLHTASDYVNNLLLARGLLRNGKPLDFACPADSSGSTDATMARIINLVHDLVLRRDREAEQRENLATTIRNLRNTESKQTVEIEQLRTETSDLSRSLAIAEGQERTFKTTIRTVEATNRGLKEQVQRMKTSLQQVRAQCANDIRKRDIEIQKLKAHLSDRQRGKRDAFGVTTISITPAPKAAPGKVSEGGAGLENPGYSLKQETTEFLTRLCQDLSDENDALISILKDSIHTLKILQGFSDKEANEMEEVDQTDGNKEPSSGSESQSMPPPQYETLSAEMTLVLDQLRLLLTNPSFVPLEEVEIRDTEIFRLKDGWEKIETRWREAIAMMDGWHRRIAKGGESINVDELQQGMGLGLGIDEQMHAFTRANEGDSFSRSGLSTREPFGDQSHSNLTVDSPNLTPQKKVTLQDTALEERSGNSRPNSRRGKVAPTHDSREGSKENDDETTSLDKPGTTKRQKTGLMRQRETKIPRQASRTQTDLGIAEKLPTARSEAQEAEEERKSNQQRKRPNSTRALSRKISRRKTTLTSVEE